MRYVSIVCAALLLFAPWPAGAADTLLGSFGSTFSFYHLYDKPDGATDIEEISASASGQPESVPGVLSLFDSPADVVVRWKAGSISPTPLHTARRTEVTVVLQGDLVFSVKGGKEERVRAGQVVLVEDYTGTGHSVRCEAANQAMGCIQIFLYPRDDRFLRAVQRSGVGFCAANCEASKR